MVEPEMELLDSHLMMGALELAGDSLVMECLSVWEMYRVLNSSMVEPEVELLDSHLIMGFLELAGK